MSISFATMSGVEQVSWSRHSVLFSVRRSVSIAQRCPYRPKTSCWDDGSVVKMASRKALAPLFVWLHFAHHQAPPDAGASAGRSG